MLELTNIQIGWLVMAIAFVIILVGAIRIWSDDISERLHKKTVEKK